jgi:hypothetical protein
VESRMVAFGKSVRPQGPGRQKAENKKPPGCPEGLS